MTLVAVEVLPSLEEHATYLREQFAIGAGATAAIARRLAEVQEQTGWTQAAIGQWCESEGLGFGSQAQVSQALSYGRLIITAVINDPPPEGTLRPLAKALNKGLSPEEAATIWAEATDTTDPVTGDRVSEIVEAHPFVKKLRREQKRKKREREAKRSGTATETYDPEDPDTAFAECKAIIGDITTRCNNATRAEMALHLLDDNQLTWLVSEVRSAADFLIDHIRNGAQV